MKNYIFTIGLILVCGLISAQDKKSYPTVGSVKTIDTKGKPVNGDQKSNQDVKQEEEKPVIIQTLEYKVDEKGNPTYTDSNIPTIVNSSENSTSEEPVPTIDEQIATVDANIAAIDSKVEWVKSHPKQHENALSTGWYTQMETSKSEWLAKKQELINSKK